MTKIDKIEQVLLAGKKVTRLTAIQICGAMRLAALIFDLKKRGHKIQTNIMQDTQGNDYAEYRLFTGPTAPVEPEVAPAVVVAPVVNPSAYVSCDECPYRNDLKSCYAYDGCPTNAQAAALKAQA